jgi:hypothetical protein
VLAAAVGDFIDVVGQKASTVCVVLATARTAAERRMVEALLGMMKLMRKSLVNSVMVVEIAEVIVLLLCCCVYPFREIVTKRGQWNDATTYCCRCCRRHMDTKRLSDAVLSFENPP